MPSLKLRCFLIVFVCLPTTRAWSGTLGSQRHQRYANRLNNSPPDSNPEQNPRRPAEVQRTFDKHKSKYFCTDCGVPFTKEKNFKEHLEGKAHKRAVASRATAWDDFKASAPSWAAEDDPTMDVLTAWGASDLSKFPLRATCLDPSPTLRKLSPAQRARFYRYLRDNFGEHYPELAAIFHHMDTFKEDHRFLRVKELFESLEAFKVIASVVLTAQQQGRTIDTIYDMACGHGLVGILLAYRFPRKQVVLVDLERRPAFDAYVEAWEAEGFAYIPTTANGGCCNDLGVCNDNGGVDPPSPLGNVEYREADLNDALQNEVGPNSLVIAMHGCNEANTDVVNGARAKGALWSVMPCCIRQGLALSECSVEVADDTRFLLLSGAFANEHGAQMIRAIDRRITARPLIISGGLDRATAQKTVPSVSTDTNGAPTSKKPKRPRRSKCMPR